MSFSSDLVKFNKNYEKNFIKVRKGASFDLFSAIALSTPVKKGILRNNWFVGIGAGSTSTTSAGDKQGVVIINSIRALLERTRLENDIYLTNNLPYAAAIEYDGHSAKAPEGMVRINVRNWDRIVNANVRKVVR